MAIIGILTGAVGITIRISMEALVEVKYNQLEKSTSCLRCVLQCSDE